MSTQRTINIFFAICFLFTISCRERTPDIVGPIIVTSLRPGVNEIVMEFDGLMRDITIQLPEGFHQETSYPVVFFFHGLGGNKGFGESVMGPLVDEENFIGIYPQDHLNSGNTGGNKIPSTADDVGLTLHILNWLKTEISVDEDSIYSLGYSNGGAFSYTLALRTNVIAAIASMSASFFNRKDDCRQRSSIVGDSNPWRAGHGRPL